jgi:hypothetical protein
MSDPFQTSVAGIALAAAAPYGFALAGGQALMAHGLLSRPTEDIDLFTDREGAAKVAAPPVRRALALAGLTTEVIASTAELGEMFDGFDEEMAEIEVSSPGATVRLTLCRFDRSLPPVRMDIGDVLHLDDVLGGKVAAMASRAEPRDFVDVAAALRRFSQEVLIGLAYRQDPSLRASNFREAMRQLDRLPDNLFVTWADAAAMVEIRQAFAGWAR